MHIRLASRCFQPCVDAVFNDFWPSRRVCILPSLVSNQGYLGVLYEATVQQGELKGELSGLEDAARLG